MYLFGPLAFTSVLFCSSPVLPCSPCYHRTQIQNSYRCA